jgi:hypothetical protein
MMKRVFALLCACVIAMSCVMHAFAADGNVTYSGNSGKFIFAPGSEYSPTDLFPNFKDVMPGDSITQKITVHNKASNKVKVKIYLRALGAHEDSEEFLSQLKLRVRKSGDNTMAYMFDAAADETAQLTDWVCIGTLYSGGKVNLDVILDVPVELDNKYQNEIGYLEWEFKIVELNIDPSDPDSPATGDNAQIVFWICVMGVSFVLLLILIVARKKKEEEEKQ